MVKCTKCKTEIIDPIYNALVIGFDDKKGENIVVCPKCFYEHKRKELITTKEVQK